MLIDIQVVRHDSFKRWRLHVRVRKEAVSGSNQKREVVGLKHYLDYVKVS